MTKLNRVHPPPFQIETRSEASGFCRHRTLRNQGHQFQDGPANVFVGFVENCPENKAPHHGSAQSWLACRVSADTEMGAGLVGFKCSHVGPYASVSADTLALPRAWLTLIVIEPEVFG